MAALGGAGSNEKAKKLVQIPRFLKIFVVVREERGRRRENSTAQRQRHEQQAESIEI